MKYLRPRPSALAAAVACAGLAVVTGCSSSSSSSALSGPTQASAPVASASTASSPADPATGTSPGGGNTPAVVASSSPAVTGAPSCATSSLEVKPGLAQGYAGGTYEVIDFTNTSARPCTLEGYPGVSLVSGSAHAQIGLAAKRTAGTSKVITLAPGATANALLQIVDALNYPSASCGPTQASALKVYPPNQTAPVYLASKSTACAKSISIMNIAPVQAGSGGST